MNKKLEQEVEVLKKIILLLEKICENQGKQIGIVVEALENLHRRDKLTALNIKYIDRDIKDLQEKSVNNINDEWRNI